MDDELFRAHHPQLKMIQQVNKMLVIDLMKRQIQQLKLFPFPD